MPALACPASRGGVRVCVRVVRSMWHFRFIAFLCALCVHGMLCGLAHRADSFGPLELGTGSFGPGGTENPDRLWRQR